MSQDERDIMDGLAQAARVKGRYARMLGENPTKEELRQAATFFTQWREKRNLSLGQVSNKTGLARGTISAALSLSYKGDTASILRQLLAFADNYEIAKDVVRPEGIVMTRCIRLMWSVIQQTMATRTIGVVTAPAGFGKSVVLKAASESFTGAILVEIDEKHKTATGIIKLIAPTMRIGAARASALVFDDIKNKLRESERLILVDQAHEMREDALNVLRTLNDLGCPIVLAGTRGLHGVVNDIAQGSQIYSRLGMVKNIDEEMELGDDGGTKIPMITVDEVLKICAAGELRFAADAQDFLHRLAHAPGLGSLRTCKLLIRIVAQVPGVREKAISGAMLIRAFKQLKGAGYQAYAASQMDTVKVERRATA